MLKKIILLMLVSFTCIDFIFSKPVFYSDDYRISSYAGYNLKFKRGSRALMPDTVTKVAIFNNIFEGSVGFSENAEQLDFTSSVVYWPMFMNKLNIGAGITYHCLSFSNYFLENDFLYGVFFKYTSDIDLTFEMKVNYFQKYSIIYAIKDKTPYLLNNNFAAQIKFSYFHFDKFNFQLSLGSYSYFNYKLFFTAIFSFQTDWNFHNQLWLCAETNIQYVDFFVITSHWDYFNTRLCLKVEL